MGQQQHEPAGPRPMTAETPRREAMRTMGGAGAALLGVLGLRTTADAQIGADKKKKKTKRGATGPTGPTGPAGPTSVAGLVVTSREGESFLVAPDDIESGEAGCEAGELLLGGSYSVLMSAGCRVRRTDITPANRWLVTVECDLGTTTADVTAIAFCLAVAS